MHTAEQRKNLLAVHTLMLTIEPSKFNGASCGTEHNLRGCAIHHAYWNHKLPQSLHDWFTGDRFGFWDNEDTCPVMEEVLGEGSWELFGDRACEIGHDYHTFMAELELFIGKSPEPEKLTDSSETIGTTYKVTNNGKVSEEMSLEDARKFVTVAKGLGFRGVTIVQFDVIKHVTYTTKVNKVE